MTTPDHPICPGCHRKVMPRQTAVRRGDYEVWHFGCERDQRIKEADVSRHEPTVEACVHCGAKWNEVQLMEGAPVLCANGDCCRIRATARQDDYVEQDTANCHICGDPLLTIPRLGDWIMHPRCQQEVRVRIDEAEQRATRIERARIVTDLRHLEAEGYGLPACIEYLQGEQQDTDLKGST